MARIHGRSFRTLFTSHDIFINALLSKFNENKMNGVNHVDAEWIIENVLTDVPGFAYIRHYFDWKKPHNAEKSSIMYVYSFTNSLRNKGYIIPPIKFPFGIVDSKNPADRQILNAYIFNNMHVELTGIEKDDTNPYGFHITNVVYDFTKKHHEDSGFLSDEELKFNKSVDPFIKGHFDLQEFLKSVETSKKAAQNLKEFRDRSNDLVIPIPNAKFGSFILRDEAIGNQSVPSKGMPTWKRNACKYQEKYNAKPKTVRKLAREAKVYLTWKINPGFNYLTTKDMAKIRRLVKTTKNTKLTTIIGKLNKASYINRDYSQVLTWYTKNVNIDMTWGDLLIVLRNNPGATIAPTNDVVDVVVNNNTYFPNIVDNVKGVAPAQSTQENARELCADAIRGATKITNLWLECVWSFNDHYVFEVMIAGIKFFAIGNADSYLGCVESLEDAKGYCG